MKKNAATTIAVVAMLLVLIFYRRISVLNQKISNLENTLNNRLSSLNNEVQMIHNNVDEKLDEMASIISSDSWEYGDMDFSEDKVQIIYSIIPKEFEPDHTTAILKVGDQEHKMELVNNRYELLFDVHLTEDVLVEYVEFHEAGKIRTQRLERSISPRFDYLLSIRAHYNSGAPSMKKGKADYVYGYKGILNIIAYVVDNQVDNQMNTVDIVAKLDGMEINRYPVEISLEGQEKYLTEGATESSRITRPESTMLSNNNVYYYLNHTWTIPNGSTLELSVESVDRYGYRYSTIFDLIQVNKDGSVVDDSERNMRIYNGSFIYNSKGELIFDHRAWMDTNKPLYGQ